MALRPPLPGYATAAEHKPLDTLLALKVPTSDRVLVWIDDAHEHREFGLTANNLRRLT